MAPKPIIALLECPWFGVLARVTLTFPYWTSGIVKLIYIRSSLNEVKAFALHPAWLILAITLLVELGGSLAVITSRLTWLATGAQAIFTFFAATVAYPFWAVADPVMRFDDRNAFFEHIGLIGGFMLAAILADRERRQ
ncbi:DoxX family protein [Dyella caseinilytica]|uniref:DoxX family protein n=1 Tax=Dyella caseinilytica TaxID=1849581 RepID=A0ABX7H087_9GAMM|nr:DoxX family protein [Dyella caseinilytica]QRN55317.1 DoxX family protein [Dyella caseinilytica]GGA00923.1 hypothetical protein GCM10011408_22460 [Dyella caseinilytica]